MPDGRLPSPRRDRIRAWPRRAQRSDDLNGNGEGRDRRPAPGPLLVVAGSPRVERRSFRVAQYVRDRLSELMVEVELVDPLDYPLPAYDGATSTPASVELAARFLAAPAFVFVVPEWHAGIPGSLKNMIDYLGGAHFDGKPVGLVAVSAAGGGASVLSHLRDVLAVLGAVLVSPPIAVRNVKSAFADDGRLADARLDAALLTSLERVLRLQAGAVARLPVREAP